MHTVRKYLSWVFAFTSLVCLWVIPLTMKRPYPFRLLLLAPPALFVGFAVVFGMAWWTVFQGRSSARWWGIGASLINIQISLLPMLIPPRSIRNGFSLVLAIGVIGLVAFARRFEQTVSTANPQRHRSIPGDGTVEILNKTIQVLSIAACLLAYHWWLGWVKRTGVPAVENAWYQTFAFTIIGLVIALVHETGHAVTGLALGMKLQAFVVGPFQWHLRDGRWKFELNLRDLLGVGKVGIVPPRVDFPRWARLCMLVAGVFANFVTGIIAGLAAWLAQPDSPVQARGLLILFGIWSIVIAAANLMPFRVGQSYSDGARIYQLLSKGRRFSTA